MTMNYERWKNTALAYCWAQSQHLFGTRKECHKNPAWIFIYLSICLSVYLSIYLSFIIHLLHAKHLDKSKHKIEKKKKIQIPKHIIMNYTSSCQQNPYKLSKCT